MPGDRSGLRHDGSRRAPACWDRSTRGCGICGACTVAENAPGHPAPLRTGRPLEWLAQTLLGRACASRFWPDELYAKCGLGRRPYCAKPDPEPIISTTWSICRHRRLPPLENLRTVFPAPHQAV